MGTGVAKLPEFGMLPLDNQARYLGLDIQKIPYGHLIGPPGRIALPYENTGVRGPPRCLYFSIHKIVVVAYRGTRINTDCSYCASAKGGHLRCMR